MAEPPPRQRETMYGQADPTRVTAAQGARRILRGMNAPRPLPNIGAPAARALAAAGVENLDDVEKAGIDNLATLHGVGPKAVRLLRAALGE